MEQDKIKEIFSALHEIRHKLTSWQLQYIDSVQRQWKNRQYISDHQLRIISDILKYA